MAAVEELTKTFIMDANATATAETAPPADREPTLSLLNGTRMGFVYTLQGASAVIGRSPECEIVLEDDGISRRHAKLTMLPSSVEIEDLQSTNGVFVDGVRIAGKLRLSDGARVRVARS